MLDLLDVARSRMLSEATTDWQKAQLQALVEQYRTKTHSELATCKDVAELNAKLLGIFNP